MSNITSAEIAQLNRDCEQLSKYIQRLKEQLESKKRELKNCNDCHQELLKAKNNFESLLNDAFSFINKQSSKADPKVKILRRSFNNMRNKLNDGKIVNAKNEFSTESHNLLRHIGNIENDIIRLKTEISQKENQLWDMNNRRYR